MRLECGARLGARFRALWPAMRARVVAAWPAMRARLVEDGGLRSVLVLVLALGQGARADGLAEALAPALATAFGLISLVMPPLPANGEGRFVSYLMVRLSARGTWRSLSAVVLALGHGASASDLADHLEVLAVLGLGAVSAAMKPGGSGR